MIRRLALSLVLASVLVAPTRARADRDAATSVGAGPARAHVDAGVAAYEAGDYEAASRAFEAAYALDPSPALLYAWAQSLRMGNRCAEALALYRRYLASDPTETQVAAATHGIAACAEALAASAAPPTLPDRDPTPAPPARDPAPAWYRDPVGGGLVVGGVVAAAAGVVFLARSGTSRDEADRAELRDDFVRHLEDATRERRLGAVGIGLGAGLITGGILRYLSRRSEPAVGIAVTPTSFGVLARF
jgi:tetratricopeptide (TPR) repeat protein